MDAILDDVGNFTGLISSGQSYQFGYDPLYRLTELRQGSSVLEHFDYDVTGNRTAANLGGAAQSYAYPTNSHRLQSINGIGRDYDNVGNTTQRDGLTYTYNGRNRLSRVSMGRTTYYSNTYNARGEREEKSLTNGMTVQRFVYDEAGRLIQTGNVSPVGLTRTLKPEQRLLWLDDQLVGVKIKATSGAYAGELLYAHTDHLGTPRALSRASNNSTVWRWPLETSAFGQHPAQPDPDSDGQALTFNLRYPGQYFDAESGLHYNYFRDFEAGTGRYIESDPIGLRGGISTFGYVRSDPLKRSDRFGLDDGFGTPLPIRPMGDNSCQDRCWRETLKFSYPTREDADRINNGNNMAANALCAAVGAATAFASGGAIVAVDVVAGAVVDLGCAAFVNPDLVYPGDSHEIELEICLKNGELDYRVVSFRDIRGAMPQ